MYDTSVVWIGSLSTVPAVEVSAMGAENRLPEDPLKTLPGPVISGVAGNPIVGVEVIIAAAAVNGKLPETTAGPSRDWLGTMPILNLLTVSLGLRGALKPTVRMSVTPEVAIGKLVELRG